MWRPPSDGPLVLQRAWPREPGHVLVEMARDDGRWVAGQWFADRERLAAVARVTPAPATALPDHGLLLQPDGADRRLSSLATLLQLPEAELVAHRPERRAVVRRVEGGRLAYTKVLRPERAMAIVGAAARARRAAADNFAVPELLAPDVASGILEWAALPGRSLLSLGADERVPLTHLAAAWRRTGEAVARLHAGETQALTEHSGSDERRLTVRWLESAQTHGLLPALDLEPMLSPLLDPAGGCLGLLHRDLHDKQVVVDGTDIGILDLDTVAVGERVVDVANLLVHLELRVLQGLLTPERAAHAATAFRDGVGADSLPEQRLDAYLTATRLRLAAVYAFRPRWQHVALRLIGISASPRPTPRTLGNVEPDDEVRRTAWRSRVSDRSGVNHG